MTWDDYDYEYSRKEYSYEPGPAYRKLPGWKFDNDLLVDDWDHPRKIYAERIIKVG